MITAKEVEICEGRIKELKETIARYAKYPEARELIVPLKADLLEFETRLEGNVGLQQLRKI